MSNQHDDDHAGHHEHDGHDHGVSDDHDHSNHGHTLHGEMIHDHDHSHTHDEDDDGAHGHSHHDHSHHGHGHHGHGHHGHHGDDHAEMFRKRFWVSLILSIPVIIVSPMVMDWFNYSLDFPGVEWIGPVLGSIIFFWAGWPFLEGGWSELKHRQPGMMLLISMAISVAYVASLATSLGFFELDFWWELAALVTIMLLGHWQEMNALGQAQDAVAALAELLPDEAERVMADGSVESVAVDQLHEGDVVLIRSGARVPADGEIIDGAADLDESMITGESQPVTRSVGDEVVAGTISTDSAIRVRVNAVGDDTTLAGIQRLVSEAESSQSRAQALADRAAALLFYVATGAAIITAIVWAIIGDADQVITRVVTVLVISCPHALGLAIPLTTSISSALAARNGILVKDRLSLELARNIDAFLFDKTGTLTKGEHVVVGVAGIEVSDDQLLGLAAGVESNSEHPLARAIIAAAKERGVDIAEAHDFRSATGRGVEATIDGTPYAVGGPNMLRERSLSEPTALDEWTHQWRDRGASILYMTRGEEIIGGIALEDEVRPEAYETVREIQAAGAKVILITGDAQQVGDAVGRDLGVDEVMAEVLPEDKAAKVAELQNRGLTVAMVGDGVNDAPALARADVGIAIGAGTDVAIESAGLILASSDPRAIVSILELSNATYRKSVQNLWWAGGYNIIAIPVAAGALMWAGISIPPALAAALMSASTIIVAANAQLLRRMDLTR